jgi:hypothetical protein
VTSLFLWGYVKDIVYRTSATSFDELRLTIVAAIETVTPQMLENTWREIEYRLDILRATKGAHVGSYLQFCSIDSEVTKLLELHFHTA